MDNVNETGFGACRFLDDSHFELLYETFIQAFADYVVPFALTETQFRNHINLNGVDLNRTLGYFVGDALVGFSLNGFGRWNGLETVYDAGTGVVPDHRRRGISEAMFETMLTRFADEGIRQFLLEVVTTNAAAVRLYEKLGFTAGRMLALLQCDTRTISAREKPGEIELREMEMPDRELFESFWDTRPSWQNSPEAIDRSIRVKRIMGAWAGNRCVGYVIFSSNFGRLSQLAVDPEYRRRGIGTSLVKAMEGETADGFSLQVINIDKANAGAMEFFRKLGFYERLSQHEMVLRF